MSGKALTFRAGVPVPPTCPPGVSRRQWARWAPDQRQMALMRYWQSLTVETRYLLDLKYGNRAEVTRGQRRAGFMTRRAA